MNQTLKLTVAAMALLLCQIWAGHSLYAQATTEDELVFPPVTNGIKGILIVPTREEIVLDGVRGVNGIEVRGPEFLKTKRFEKLMSPFIGQLLTFDNLRKLQLEIIKYSREEGHPVIDVHLPEQEVLDDTVQFAVVEGKVGKITVENPGRKWVSEKTVLRGVGLQPGDTVQSAALNRDLAWLNQNTYQSLGVFDGTFSEVTGSFSQGGLGETDLKLNVRDRFPLRVYAGYEDSGFEVIGEHRFFVGLNYANVLGLDHRLNYQFTADNSFDLFRAHAASYIIPLPWKHELLFFGGYADLKPDYGRLNDPSLADFTNDGEAYQASARYVVPLPTISELEHRISAGADFKRTDTTLLFGGLDVSDNKIDVMQFTADWSGRIRDKLGGTAFSLMGVYSPGELTEYNHQSDYTQFAPGSEVEYFYGRLDVRRETQLPFGFTWYIRGAGQLSDSELTPSETFGLGGWSTIRGYNERVINSSEGWMVVNELRTPHLILGNLTQLEGRQDWLQGLVFVDYGRAFNSEPIGGYNENYTLISVGFGLRYQMAENLRFRLDYGFQLEDEYKTAPSASLEDQPNERAHIGLEVSF